MKTTDYNTRALVYCALFIALMTVGAFIKIMIPIGPFAVTFSLQFFFALLAGFILGGKLGFCAVGGYLAVGLLGIPVFAHGGGLAYLLKPTFGFLLGFAAAAFLAGFLMAHIRKKTYAAYLLAAVCGEMVYYLCGLVYYYFMFNFYINGGTESISVAQLISVWFLSTAAPDFALCVLAALAAERLNVVLRKTGLGLIQERKTGGS